MDQLAIEFEQTKIHFSSDQRRSLRQHFLSLADECIKLDDSRTAAIIKAKFADSAYKLPYCKSTSKHTDNYER